MFFTASTNFEKAEVLGIFCKCICQWIRLCSTWFRTHNLSMTSTRLIYRQLWIQ